MASINWAMTGPSGSPLALPSEKFLFTAEAVTLSLFPSQPGAPLTQAPDPAREYAVPGGRAFVSNRRVVFVSPGDGARGKKPVGKEEGLRTFSVPLERAVDGRLMQPWFGAPYWEALVASAREGGLEVSGPVAPTGVQCEAEVTLSGS